MRVVALLLVGVASSACTQTQPESTTSSAAGGTSTGASSTGTSGGSSASSSTSVGSSGTTGRTSSSSGSATGTSGGSSTGGSSTGGSSTGQLPDTLGTPCTGPTDSTCPTTAADCVEGLIDGGYFCSIPCQFTSDCDAVGSVSGTPNCNAGFCEVLCGTFESTDFGDCPPGLTCISFENACE
jgi:hypothetical protein